MTKIIIRRSLAACLIILFVAQEFLAAAPTQNTVLSLTQAVPTTGSFQVDARYGKITERYDAGVGPLLILVEDAHFNYSAQSNYRSMLSQWMKDYDLSTVYSEAGTQDNSLMHLRSLASQESREQIAEDFLRKGQIKGDDYLSLCANKPLSIIGVEDKELYQKAIDYFTRIITSRAGVLLALENISRKINRLKEFYYPREIFEFDQLGQSYQKEEVSFEQYFKSLNNLSNKLELNITEYPALRQMRKIIQLEKSIDFDQANQEQLWMMSQLTPTQLQGLRDSMGSVDNKQPMTFTRARALLEAHSLFVQSAHRSRARQSHGLRNIRLYHRYLRLLSECDNHDFINQTKALRDRIYQVYLSSRQTKFLHEIGEYVDTLKKLFTFQITRIEFEKYSQDSLKERFYTVSWMAYLNTLLHEAGRVEESVFYESTLDELRKIADEYYRLHDRRDEAFLENLIRYRQAVPGDGKPYVLIAGGYHAWHLGWLLKQRNMSYVRVMPNVFEKTRMSIYEKALRSQSQNLDVLRIGEDAPRLSLLVRDLSKGKRVPRSFATLAGARLAKKSAHVSPRKAAVNSQAATLDQFEFSSRRQFKQWASSMASIVNVLDITEKLYSSDIRTLRLIRMPSSVKNEAVYMVFAKVSDKRSGGPKSRKYKVAFLKVGPKKDKGHSQARLIYQTSQVRISAQSSARFSPLYLTHISSDEDLPPVMGYLEDESLKIINLRSGMLLHQTQISADEVDSWRENFVSMQLNVYRNDKGSLRVQIGDESRRQLVDVSVGRSSLIPVSQSSIVQAALASGWNYFVDLIKHADTQYLDTLNLNPEARQYIQTIHEHGQRYDVKQLVDFDGYPRITTKGLWRSRPGIISLSGIPDAFHKQVIEHVKSFLRNSADQTRIFDPQTLTVESSSTLSIDVVRSGVSKTLSVHWLDHHAAEVLEVIGYRAGRQIDMRQNPEWIFVNANGALFERSVFEPKKDLERSPAYHALLDYLEAGGVVVVMSNDDARDIARRILGHGAYLPLKRNILIAANGGSSLHYFDEFGQLVELKNYRWNALNEWDSSTGTNRTCQHPFIYVGAAPNNRSQQDVAQFIGDVKRVYWTGLSAAEDAANTTDRYIGEGPYGTAALLEKLTHERHLWDARDPSSMRESAISKQQRRPLKYSNDQSWAELVETLHSRPTVLVLADRAYAERYAIAKHWAMLNENLPAHQRVNVVFYPSRSFGDQAIEATDQDYVRLKKIQIWDPGENDFVSVYLGEEHALKADYLVGSINWTRTKGYLSPSFSRKLEDSKIAQINASQAVGFPVRTVLGTYSHRHQTSEFDDDHDTNPNDRGISEFDLKHSRGFARSFIDKIQLMNAQRTQEGKAPIHRVYIQPTNYARGAKSAIFDIPDLKDGPAAREQAMESMAHILSWITLNRTYEVMITEFMEPMKIVPPKDRVASSLERDIWHVNARAIVGKNRSGGYVVDPIRIALYPEEYGPMDEIYGADEYPEVQEAADGVKVWKIGGSWHRMPLGTFLEKHAVGFEEDARKREAFERYVSTRATSFLQAVSRKYNYQADVYSVDFAFTSDIVHDASSGYDFPQVVFMEASVNFGGEQAWYEQTGQMNYRKVLFDWATHSAGRIRRKRLKEEKIVDASEPSSGARLSSFGPTQARAVNIIEPDNHNLIPPVVDYIYGFYRLSRMTGVQVEDRTPSTLMVNILSVEDKGALSLDGADLVAGKLLLFKGEKSFARRVWFWAMPTHQALTLKETDMDIILGYDAVGDSLESRRYVPTGKLYDTAVPVMADVSENAKEIYAVYLPFFSQPYSLVKTGDSPVGYVKLEAYEGVDAQMQPVDIRRYSVIAGLLEGLDTTLQASDKPITLRFSVVHDIPQGIRLLGANGSRLAGRGKDRGEDGGATQAFMGKFPSVSESSLSLYALALQRQEGRMFLKRGDFIQALKRKGASQALIAELEAHRKGKKSYEQLQSNVQKLAQNPNLDLSLWAASVVSDLGNLPTDQVQVESRNELSKGIKRFGEAWYALLSNWSEEKEADFSKELPRLLHVLGLEMDDLIGLRPVAQQMMNVHEFTVHELSYLTEVLNVELLLPSGYLLLFSPMMGALDQYEISLSKVLNIKRIQNTDAQLDIRYQLPIVTAQVLRGSQKYGAFFQPMRLIIFTHGVEQRLANLLETHNFIKQLGVPAATLKSLLERGVQAGQLPPTAVAEAMAFTENVQSRLDDTAQLRDDLAWGMIWHEFSHWMFMVYSGMPVDVLGGIESGAQGMSMTDAGNDAVRAIEKRSSEMILRESGQLRTQYQSADVAQEQIGIYHMAHEVFSDLVRMTRSRLPYEALYSGHMSVVANQSVSSPDKPEGYDKSAEFILQEMGKLLSERKVLSEQASYREVYEYLLYHPAEVSELAQRVLENEFKITAPKQLELHDDATILSARLEFVGSDISESAGARMASAVQHDPKMVLSAVELKQILEEGWYQTEDQNFGVSDLLGADNSAQQKQRVMAFRNRVEHVRSKIASRIDQWRGQALLDADVIDKLTAVVDAQKTLWGRFSAIIKKKKFFNKQGDSTDDALYSFVYTPREGKPVFAIAKELFETLDFSDTGPDSLTEFVIVEFLKSIGQEPKPELLRKLLPENAASGAKYIFDNALEDMSAKLFIPQPVDEHLVGAVHDYAYGISQDLAAVDSQILYPGSRAQAADQYHNSAAYTKRNKALQSAIDILAAKGGTKAVTSRLILAKKSYDPRGDNRVLSFERTGWLDVLIRRKLREALEQLSSGDVHECVACLSQAYDIRTRLTNVETAPEDTRSFSNDDLALLYQAFETAIMNLEKDSLWPLIYKFYGLSYELAQIVAGEENINNISEDVDVGHMSRDALASLVEDWDVKATELYNQAAQEVRDKGYLDMEPGRWQRMKTILDEMSQILKAYDSAIEGIYINKLIFDLGLDGTLEKLFTPLRRFYQLYNAFIRLESNKVDELVSIEPFHNTVQPIDFRNSVGNNTWVSLEDFQSVFERWKSMHNIRYAMIYEIASDVESPTELVLMSDKNGLYVKTLEEYVDFSTAWKSVSLEEGDRLIWEQNGRFVILRRTAGNLPGKLSSISRSAALTLNYQLDLYQRQVFGANAEGARMAQLASVRDAMRASGLSNTQAYPWPQQENLYMIGHKDWQVWPVTAQLYGYRSQEPIRLSDVDAVVVSDGFNLQSVISSSNSNLLLSRHAAWHAYRGQAQWRQFFKSLMNVVEQTQPSSRIAILLDMDKANTFVDFSEAVRVLHENVSLNAMLKHKNIHLDIVLRSAEIASGEEDLPIFKYIHFIRIDTSSGDLVDGYSSYLTSNVSENMAEQINISRVVIGASLERLTSTIDTLGLDKVRQRFGQKPDLFGIEQSQEQRIFSMADILFASIASMVGPQEFLPSALSRQSIGGVILFVVRPIVDERLLQWAKTRMSVLSAA